MATPQKTSFGEPISHQICIFYDAASGNVLHVHQHLTYPGGPKFSDEEVDAEGRSVLGRRRKDSMPELESIFVQPQDYQEGSQYRVDLGSPRRLVKT
jgi:hypothetical protein